MKELISIHVGQAGINIGEACLEQFTYEHGITQSGTFEPQDNLSSSNSCHTMFHESESGSFNARSLFFDLDQDKINHIKKGSYKSLLSSENFVLGKESSSDIFSRARCIAGHSILNECLEATRKQVEKCDSLEGFIFYHSVGGGTGGGLGTLLCEHFSIDYNGKYKLSNAVFPSPDISPSCVEPINSMLCISYMIENNDLTICYDNKALYRILYEELYQECPIYEDINRLIAFNVANVTRSMRFGGENNCSFREIKSKLVPYPMLLFLTSSYSPWTPKEKAYYYNYSVKDITCQAFNPNSFMTSCDIRQSKLIACSLNYSGNINYTDANNALSYMNLESPFKFVENESKKLSVNINPHTSIVNPYSGLAKTSISLSTLCNSTGISSIISLVSNKFMSLYSKRAYVHWFVGEGMESGEFRYKYENLRALERDYVELEKNHD
ncbi:hypothetical protein SteCoe_12699 [Stentor coeruleus]|uniref:Tubulin/FtsZ GTPase domain-containing protein n=1 Tax=Stentor coeruleus TaxID=5963 RepID=A0A1R2CA33_9CILI|nr:hypothetical protein SteCoe_12699 [Stentor coeruleus]